MAAGGPSEPRLTEGGEDRKQVTCLPGEGESAGEKGGTGGPGRG